MTSAGTATQLDGVWLDRTICLVSIVCLAGAISAVLGTQPVGEPGAADIDRISETGDLTKQVILLCLYATNLMLLLWRFGIGAVRFVGLPLLALIALCFISTAWSPMPDATLRRSVATLGPIIVGTFAGLRFDERELTRILQVAAAATIIGSLVYGTLFPSLGFDVHGQLRGLFSHKNEFGGFMIICALPIAYRVALDEPPRVPHVIVLVACLGCFALARSASPIVSGLMAIATLSAGYAFQKSAGLVQSIAPGLICIIAAVILVFGSDIAAMGTELLGRDGSFSGRTNIWDFVLSKIAERPWLGYGYGIFWLGADAPGALFWYWSKQFELHAHDGYLQLMLDTGIVGLLLFLGSVATLAARTATLAVSGRAKLATFIAMYLAFYLVESISESVLWEPNGLLPAIFIWATVRAALETSQVKLAASTVRRSMPFAALQPAPVR